MFVYQDSPWDGYARTLNHVFKPTTQSREGRNGGEGKGLEQHSQAARSDSCCLDAPCMNATVATLNAMISISMK